MSDTPSRTKADHGPVMPRRRKFLITGLGVAAASLMSLAVAGNMTRLADAAVGKKHVQGAATTPMRIGVIGAGSLGGSVGRALVQARHEVMFSSRHPDELVYMIRELGPRATVGTPLQAAQFGTVLLFAVPYDALPQLGRDLKEAMRGKVVLDACNPASGSGSALAREAEANGVAETSAKYLPGTRLVRAFSAVDASAVETSASGQSGKLGVPIAGNDAKAVQVAAQLVRDAGCEPVVVGNGAAARRFQRGGLGFRANTTAPKLRRLLGLSDRS
jgi:8-hydroxy-5-deazaflavin:NADPH oxidoreductase